MNVPLFFYADRQSLLEKICTYENNQINLFTSKINIHLACGNTLFTHCSLGINKNKHDFYQGKDSDKERGKIIQKTSAIYANKNSVTCLIRTKIL